MKYDPNRFTLRDFVTIVCVVVGGVAFAWALAYIVTRLVGMQ